MLFGFGSAAGVLIPGAIAKGKREAVRLSKRLISWGWYMGVVLGFVQLLSLPLINILSPLGGHQFWVFRVWGGFMWLACFLSVSEDSTDAGFLRDSGFSAALVALISPPTRRRFLLKLNLRPSTLNTEP